MAATPCGAKTLGRRGTCRAASPAGNARSDPCVQAGCSTRPWAPQSASSSRLPGPCPQCACATGLSCHHASSKIHTLHCSLDCVASLATVLQSIISGPNRRLLGANPPCKDAPPHSKIQVGRADSRDGQILLLQGSAEQAVQVPQIPALRGRVVSSEKSQISIMQDNDMLR